MTASACPEIILAAAIELESRPEAQNRLICIPGTVSDMPDSKTAARAILPPCSECGSTQPMMTSSIDALSKPFRVTKRCNIDANKYTGLNACNLPCGLPIPRGVL